MPGAWKWSFAIGRISDSVAALSITRRLYSRLRGAEHGSITTRWRGGLIVQQHHFRTVRAAAMECAIRQYTTASVCGPAPKLYEYMGCQDAGAGRFGARGSCHLAGGNAGVRTAHPAQRQWQRQLPAVRSIPGAVAESILKRDALSAAIPTAHRTW
eukprot:3979273-Pleurochrysis_carterae.AAC.2